MFFPLVALATFFFGTLAIVLLPFIRTRTVSALCGGGWARLLAYAAPVRIRVTGRRNIDRRRSYVIVSNHQSHFDILVIYGWLGVDFKWVMKKELRKVPFMGSACARGGHIFIDRFDGEAARASLEEAKQRITGGTSIVFFPEGTRSRDGHLGEFKKGAFVMAVDMGLPILPVSIAGSARILPARTLDLFPGRIDMIIHPPIDASGCGREGIKALMDETRRVIQSGLDPLPGGRP